MDSISHSSGATDGTHPHSAATAAAMKAHSYGAAQVYQEASLPTRVSSMPPSSVEAMATAPAGATTGPVTATGFAAGPPCGAVTAEKAIGEARVDASFLNALQPNMREM